MRRETKVDVFALAGAVVLVALLTLWAQWFVARIYNGTSVQCAHVDDVIGVVRRPGPVGEHGSATPPPDRLSIIVPDGEIAFDIPFDAKEVSVRPPSRIEHRFYATGSCPAATPSN